MPSVRASLSGIVGLVVLGLLVMVWLLSERLESTTLKLETTSAQLAGVVTGLAELEKNLKESAAREVVRTETREIIISAPETDNAAVAPVLLEGLRGADRIGAMP